MPPTTSSYMSAGYHLNWLLSRSVMALVCNQLLMIPYLVTISVKGIIIISCISGKKHGIPYECKYDIYYLFYSLSKVLLFLLSHSFALHMFATLLKYAGKCELFIVLNVLCYNRHINIESRAWFSCF